MALTKYTVVRTNIADMNGNKVREGEVVELDAKTAKHYNKLGYLAPYIPEDNEDEDDDDDTGGEGNGEVNLVVGQIAGSARTADPDKAPAKPARSA